jgi:DNA-3-methyladenine glycosylase II
MGSQGTFRLRPTGPFNFDLSFAFYRRSKFEMVDQFSDRYFIRPLLFGNEPVLIKIPCGNGPSTASFRIEWESPAEIEDIKGLRQLLTKMFYIDFDIDTFYRHSLDRVMVELTRRYVGFRPILTPDIFESAAWAIIGQQVNLQFAYRLKSRVVEYVNRSFILRGRRYFVFPTAAEIADIDYDTLRSMQFSGRKAEYLLDFAWMVAGGELELESLPDIDYEAAQDKLLAIRGIGPWSANYILMRGAGHRDAFPVGDSGINNAVRVLYHLKEQPKQEYLIELSQCWRPYRSLATFYLWKSL